MISGNGVRIAYFYDITIPSRLAAPIQILNTCHKLAELGVHVTVYTNRITVADSAECLAFYNLIPHPCLRIVPLFEHPWKRLALRRRLAAELARMRDGTPTVLVSRGEPGLLLFDHLRRIAPHPHWRFVYEAHKICFVQQAEELPPTLFAQLRARLLRTIERTRTRERQAITDAHGLICLTHGVQQALEHAFQIQRPTLVLPSGVHIPPATPLDDTVRDIDILYAGKLERRKGVYDLVAALRYLPGRQLTIAGGSEEQVARLRAAVQEQGVTQQVAFLGYVAPRHMAALYRRARVGVCPLPTGESSISETFTSPLKVLDMMALGVPIVATDLPSLREILTHDQTALLTRPGDPQDLAHGIQQLLDDRTTALRLARAARAASEHYAWENRARRMLEFVREL